MQKSIYYAFDISRNFLICCLLYIISFSATSFGKLDEYIEYFRKQKKAEFMDAFNVGLKVTPSYNCEEIILMEYLKSANSFDSLIKSLK